MIRNWRAFAIPLGLFVLGAGCGGDGNGAEQTTSAAVSTASTASSTTAPATSTSPTSSTAPSTTPPETSTSTTLSPNDAVAAAYRAFYEAYLACLRDPDACDPAPLTASQGQGRQKLTEAVQELRNSDLHVGPEDAGYMVIESVTVDPVAQKATVTACWWDTGVLYGPPARPGDPEIVVNNLQVTNRFETTLFLEGGQWRVGEENRISRVEGVNQCPPEG
jgi:hypothetical protein